MSKLWMLLVMVAISGAMIGCGSDEKWEPDASTPPTTSYEGAPSEHAAGGGGGAPAGGGGPVSEHAP